MSTHTHAQAHAQMQLSLPAPSLAFPCLNSKPKVKHKSPNHPTTSQVGSGGVKTVAEAMTCAFCSPGRELSMEIHGNLWTDILNASSGPCRNSPPEAMKEWGFLLVPHKELSVESNLCPELREIWEQVYILFHSLGADCPCW